MAFGVLGGIAGAAGGGTTIGRAVIDVGISSYRLRNDMRRITHGIKGESKLWGMAFRGAMVGLQAIAVTVGATIVASIGQAEKFNSTMARVYALTDLGEGSAKKLEDRFNALHDAMLKLGPAVSMGPAKLAEALYFITSVGIRDPAAAINAVTKAAQAAAAGQANIEDVSKAFIALYNAYELSSTGAKGFTKVSDIVTQTVIRGAAEYNEVAKAIGPVGVFAHTAGVKIEELGAAFAVLTTRGLTSRRTGQALLTLFSKLAAPTIQAKKEFELLGFEYDNNVLKAKGLIGVLEMFNRQAKKNGLIVIKNAAGVVDWDKTLDASSKNNSKYFDRWRKMTGTQNAMLASIIMVGENSKDYKANLDAMNRSMGVTTKAFEDAKKKDFGLVWESAVAGVQSALVVMGEKFLPTLRDVVEWLGQKIPGAITTLSDILFNKIGPALKPMLDALRDLLGTIIGIFADKNVSGAEAMSGAVDGLVGAFVSLMGYVKDAAVTLKGIFSNEQVQIITQWAVRLAGIALSFKIISGLISGMKGRVTNLFGPMLGALSGGKLKAGAVAGAGGGASLFGPLNVAANVLNLAGKQILLAANQLLAAASFLGGGGGGGIVRGVGGRFVRAIPLVGAGVGAGVAASTAAGVAAGSATAAAAASGVASGLAAAPPPPPSLFSKAMSGMGKLFMGGLVLGIAGEFIKEPLGSFIAQNTPWKNTGEKMKEDFFGGLIDVGLNILSGGKHDFVVGLQEKTRLGNTSFDTAALQGFGLTHEQIDTIQKSQAEGVRNAGTMLMDQSALTQLQKGMTQGVGESLSAYANRIIAQAQASGLDTSGVTKQIRNGRRIETRVDPERLKQVLAQLNTSVAGDLYTVRSGLLEYVVSNVSVVNGIQFDQSTVRAALAGSPLLTTLGEVVDANINGTWDFIEEYILKQALDTAEKRGIVSAADIAGRTALDGSGHIDESDRWRAQHPQEAALAQNKWNLGVDDQVQLIADHLKELLADPAIGPQVNEQVTLWLQEFGAAIQSASSGTDAEKFKVLSLLGRVDGVDSKDKDAVALAVQQYWGLVIQEFEDATQGATTAADQGLLADRLGIIVQSSLKDGMTLIDIKAALGPLWDKLDVGMGFGTIQDRLATALSNDFGKAIAGAKTTGAKAKLLTKINALLPEGTKFKTFKAMEAAFADPKLLADIFNGINPNPAAATKFTTVLGALATKIRTDPALRGKWKISGLSLFDYAMKLSAKDGTDLLAGVAPGLVATAEAILTDPVLKKAWEGSGLALNEYIMTQVGWQGGSVVGPVARLTAAAETILNDPKLKTNWENSGLSLMSYLSSGAVTGIDVLIADLPPDLRAAATAVLNDPDLIQKWHDSGKSLMEYLSAGMKTDTSVSTTLRGILRYAGKALPGSPVKDGPFKHPFLPNAGRKIIQQIQEGMSKTGLSVPGMEVSAARMSAAGLAHNRRAFGQAQGGPQQQIYVDRMELHDRRDEASILAALQFLAPAGR